MITLGIGELVCVDGADVPGVLRRRGRHHRATASYGASRSGHHLRPADPAVLPDRGLHFVCTGADVRLHAHAAGPHAQRGARQPGAGRVRRLRHAEGALHRLHHRGLLRRHRAAGWRRSTSRSSPSEVVSGPRSGAYLLFTFLGGATFFFGPIIGAHPDGAGLRAAVGADQGLAAVPGPGLPVHGDVRAGRHRQPDHDEPAGGRVRPAEGSCGRATWRWRSRRWWCWWARRR